MATLHWVAFPPERTDLTNAVIALLGPNDAIVFIDAGLAFLHQQNGFTHLKANEYYCVGNALQHGATPINMAELVALTAHFHNTVTWYP